MEYQLRPLVPGPNASAHRFSSRVVAPLAILIDLICIIAAVPIALGIYGLLIGMPLDIKVHISAAAIAAVAFLLVRISRGAYDGALSRTQEAETGVMIDYSIGALLSVCVIWQFGLSDRFSRGLMLIYLFFALVNLLLGGFLLRAVTTLLAAQGNLSQQIVLFGADLSTTSRAIRLLELERLPHLKVIGVADDRGVLTVGSTIAGLPFIGGFSELIALAQTGAVDQVLITIPGLKQNRFDEIVEAFSGVSVDLCLLPRETMVLSKKYQVSYIGSSPVFSIWERPVRDTDVVVKWLEDKIIALTALILLSPILLLVVIAIKATSKGPILFVQSRFGFNNITISVLKFRSMYTDAEDRSGARRTQRGDTRVTPVGRIIRKLSIDELPQLWNVLRGDMSIVGPRPHATEMKVGDRFYFDAVRGYTARHRVKPGLTGLAQVRGLRGEIATVERARKRVEYDRFYIDNWSVVLDLRIIIETTFKLIGDKNAY